MKFQQPGASTFVPDGTAEEAAFARITHLGIGAHPDDLEFMAFHGILACHGRADRWFGGVTCTDGAGSSRAGPFADFSDGEMIDARRREQDAAATIGGYGAMVQLGYPSGETGGLAGDLQRVLTATRPEVVYTHNPADKHATHVGVAVAALRAMRALPPGARPRRVIGCEVWRDLDWLPDAEKIFMDVSGGEALAAALHGVFRSQIAGGKRYDLAVAGRRSAHAVFSDPRATDAASQVIFGIDLTPLVADESLDIAGHVAAVIGRFAAEVREQLDRAIRP